MTFPAILQNFYNKVNRNGLRMERSLDFMVPNNIASIRDQLFNARKIEMSANKRYLVLQSVPQNLVVNGKNVRAKLAEDMFVINGTQQLIHEGNVKIWNAIDMILFVQHNQYPIDQNKVDLVDKEIQVYAALCKVLEADFNKDLIAINESKNNINQAIYNVTIHFNSMLNASLEQKKKFFVSIQSLMQTISTHHSYLQSKHEHILNILRSYNTYRIEFASILMYGVSADSM